MSPTTKLNSVPQSDIETDQCESNDDGKIQKQKVKKRKKPGPKSSREQKNNSEDLDEQIAKKQSLSENKSTTNSNLKEKNDKKSTEDVVSKEKDKTDLKTSQSEPEISMKKGSETFDKTKKPDAKSNVEPRKKNDYESGILKPGNNDNLPVQTKNTKAKENASSLKQNSVLEDKIGNVRDSKISKNNTPSRKNSHQDQSEKSSKLDLAQDKPSSKDKDIELEHTNSISSTPKTSLKMTIKKQQVVESSSPKKKNEKKRKFTRDSSNSSSSSDEEIVKSTAKKSKTNEDEEDKLNQLKVLMKKLSEGKTENRQGLLSSFETILGKDGLSTLKSLFANSSNKRELRRRRPTISSLSSLDSSESSTDLTETSSESETMSDDSNEPLIKRRNVATRQNSKKPKFSDNEVDMKKFQRNEKSRKSRRTAEDSEGSSKKSVKLIKIRKHKKTELDKLNEDIMEMFIRDGVLNAQGLRTHKKVSYSEMKKEDFNDDIDDFSMDNEIKVTSEENKSEDDASVDCQKGSSGGDRSEREDTPPLLEELVPKLPVLKPCRVIAEKLELIDLNMPVRVLKDGSFRIHYDSLTEEEISEPNSPQLSVAKNASPTVDCNSTPSTSSNVEDMKPVAVPLSFLRNTTFENVEIITIDDDNQPLTVEPNRIKTELLSSASKIMKTVENEICNLSYFDCRNGVILKCNSEKCSTQTDDEQMFKYHIQTRHLLVKWSGSCKMCNASVYNIGSLLDEFNHMKNCHINKETTNKTPSPKKSRGRPKKARGGPKSQSVQKPTDNQKKYSNLKQTLSIAINNPTKDNTIPKPSTKNVNARVVIAAVLKVLDASKIPPSINAHSKLPVASITAQPRSTLVASLESQTSAEANIKNIEKCFTKEAPSADSSSNQTFQQVPVACSAPTSSLKLRCLPGDKLSVKRDSMLISEKQSQPNSISNTTQQHIFQPAAVSTPIPLQTDAEFFNISENNPGSRPNLAIDENPQENSLAMKRLRPWLNLIDSKRPRDVTIMLRQACLFDMFKCMGSLCSFHCNKPEDFLSHLLIHEKFHNVDSYNFRRCSYCNFVGSDSSDLMTHVKTVHKNDQYACIKCFYRSVVTANVNFHTEKYHSDSSGVFIDCKIGVPLDLRIGVKEVREIRHKFVLPITCPCKK